MINVMCQSCGKGFKLRDELVGREGKCPCGAVLIISALATAAASTAGRQQLDRRQASVASKPDRGIAHQSTARAASSHEQSALSKNSDPLPASANENGPADIKRRSRKWINILAGIAILLIVAAVAAQILFVAIPAHRKMQATLDSTVKQYDKIDAMRDKAMKQQIAQNEAALAAVTAPQTGSVSGEVWVEKGSGETLSIAGESVFLFPLEIKTDGPNGNFHDGIRTLQIPIEVARDLPGNESAAAGGKDAEKAFEPIKPFVDSPTAPSITVISAGIAVVQTKASEFKTKQLVLGHADPSDVERTITDEPFWKLMSTQSVDSVQTGRDGKFAFDNCPAGEYVLACRAFRPALGAVVYWGQKIEIKPGKPSKLDLTSTNGIVISY